MNIFYTDKYRKIIPSSSQHMEGDCAGVLHCERVHINISSFEPLISCNAFTAPNIISLFWSFGRTGWIHLTMTEFGNGWCFSSWIQTTGIYTNKVFPIFVLTPTIYLRLALPSGLFPQHLRSKIWYEFLTTQWLYSSHAYLILLRLHILRKYVVKAWGGWNRLRIKYNSGLRETGFGIEEFGPRNSWVRGFVNDDLWVSEWVSQRVQVAADRGGVKCHSQGRKQQGTPPHLREAGPFLSPQPSRAVGGGTENVDTKHQSS